VQAKVTAAAKRLKQREGEVRADIAAGIPAPFISDQDVEDLKLLRQYAGLEAEARVTTMAAETVEGWTAALPAIEKNMVDAPALAEALRSHAIACARIADRLDPPKGSETRRRMHRVNRERKAAERRGTDYALWAAYHDILSAVNAVEGIELAQVLAFDEDNRDALIELYGDLLRLEDFQIQALAAVRERLGEHAILARIAKLRAKTVENGCTAEEAATAKRMADRLERKQLA
jgi:hypothetical protein